MRHVERASVISSGIALPLLALLACSGETSSPQTPSPPQDGDPTADEVADRILPEGTYTVTYTTCAECSAGAVPDYLRLLADGVQGVVTIGDATEWSARLRLVEMREVGGQGASLLGLFAESAVVLQWRESDGTYRAPIPYGPAAEFVPIFHRAADGLACDFEIVHLKHDVGPTSCRVGK